MRRLLLQVLSHAVFAVGGFAAGIYSLPILTAPAPPAAVELAAVADAAEFRGRFRRDLAGSDFLHWGDGEVLVGKTAIAFDGRIAPGPDYRLYLSPGFPATEAEFLRLRDQMVRVGEIRTFHDFLVPVPSSVDPGAYNSVVVWCEAFGAFITAAQYR